MNHNIAINKISRSALLGLDLGQVSFGTTFSDHMFVADYEDGSWVNPRVAPLEPMPMHPGNAVLHYSQTIFEGMKASCTAEGDPILLRADMHAKRLNASARRMCMPEIPEELFLEGLKTLVSVDRDWIPRGAGSFLYLRPLMIAMDASLYPVPSQSYRFMIITSPSASPIYGKPVRLITEEFYVRAVTGGIGEAKAGGNYAGSYLPAVEAKKKGYDQLVYLESPNFQIIQEAGTMNLFFVIGDRVITPSTKGTILRGITRLSFLTMLKDRGIATEERDISIEEVVVAYREGTLREVFGAGTAAVVSPVAEIAHRDLVMKLPPVEEQKIGASLKAELLSIITGEAEDRRGWTIRI